MNMGNPEVASSSLAGGKFFFHLFSIHGELQKWCRKQDWTVKGNEIYCGSQQDKVKTRNITEKLSLQMTSMQEALALGITERGLPQEAIKN